MYKIDLEEKEKIIYVYLYGWVSSKKLKKLEETLYQMTNTYTITDVLFHIKDVTKIDRNLFATILDNYEAEFGIKIHVLDTEKTNV
ncbi:MAG: hypothetical protein PHN72_01290 [Bacilli bacterium]|nr:hypothetical protein [Bacilli bacterium]